MGHILAIDQGTTGTTALIIDGKTFKVLGRSNQEFPQIFPRPGLVEHNLDQIWGTVKVTTHEALKQAGIKSEDISAIGITNQRETTCAFNSNGEALANAIVWQDRRTFGLCEALKKKGLEEKIRNLTGLPLDPYFSASKMNWLLQNNEKVQKAHKDNELHFGTIDTFLLFKLTGHQAFKTEASNASRTLLMNLQGQWDSELLNIFEVSKNCLPSIENSFGVFGHTKGLRFLPDGIPISGILGDQQAALFGQAGINKGDLKCTYGTGAFVLLNTGDQPKFSQNGLLTTVAYQHNGKLTYALEGSCYIAGAAVQWLRDNLGIIKTSSDIEPLAASITDLDQMSNILFMPFFSGIGSPYWKSEAKAAIIGLSRDSHKGHIARACLEGIAFSINDLLKAMKQDTGLAIDKLKVDGGAVANQLLLNIQASISNANVIRPENIETTAFGAGFAAAIGSERADFSKMSTLWKQDKIFSPDPNLVDYLTAKQLQWDSYIKKMFIND